MSNNPLPGLSNLGQSYDVFDLYANPISCGQQLFDWSGTENTKNFTFAKNEYSYCNNFVVVENLNQTYTKTSSGRSISSYSTNFSSQTGLSGDYGFFSASISVNFSESSRKSTDQSFVSVLWVNSLWKVGFDLQTPPLRPEFEQDLNGLPPAKLFNKYGTHYLKNVIVGGRADAYSTVLSTSFQKSTDLQIAAELSYKSIRGSITATEKDSHSTMLDTFASNSSTTSFCVGGSSSLWGTVMNGPTAFQAWAATIPTAPVLCDFDSNSLAPIWELCTNDSRRVELQQYFTNNLKFRLEYRRLTNLEGCGSDQGSGASRDISFFRPLAAGLGEYRWVGQSAQSNYGQLEAGSAVIIVKPSHPQAVAPPVGWEPVWNDKGSGADRDYSLWRPIAPVGYVALGHLARFGVADYNPPSSEETEGFVCVHESLVVDATSGSLAWNDQGSGSNADGAIWDIVPNDKGAGVAAGTFFACQGYDTPQTPLLNVYCLSRMRTNNINT